MFELAGLGQVRDHELGVDDFDVVVGLDVARGHRAWALLVQPQLGVSRECMRSATSLRFSRMSTTSSCTPSMLVYSCSTPAISTSVWRARHRGQQHAPQRVAQRMAEAALERLDHHARLARGDRLHLDHAGLQKSVTVPCMHVTFAGS